MKRGRRTYQFGEAKIRRRFSWDEDDDAYADAQQLHGTFNMERVMRQLDETISRFSNFNPNPEFQPQYSIYARVEISQPQEQQIDPNTKQEFHIVTPFRKVSVISESAFIYGDSDEGSAIESEILKGQNLTVMYESDTWYFVTTEIDAHVGYVLRSAVGEIGATPSLGNESENVSQDVQRIPNEQLDISVLEAEGKFNYHGELRTMRKDIKPFVPLTKQQIEAYPWSEAVSVFGEVYKVGVDITQNTFDQWVRRNLIDGWQPGDRAYKINEPAWEVGKKEGLCVVDAESSGDAFGYMSKKEGVGAWFYWRRRISGELIKRQVIFDPSGNAGKEGNYFKALENGFIGSPDAFQQLYAGSYELYEASLIAVYGDAQFKEYQKAVKDGFVGSIEKFMRVFEGKHSVFVTNKALFTGATVDDIDETGLNQRMMSAATNETVISTFKEEVFDLAIIRLNRNIERMLQWKTYVLSLSPDNLYTSGKTAAYIGLQTNAQQNDREWIFNQWLDEPNPNVRNVQEQYINGVWNGGGQFCHSMNTVLQMPDEQTETPLQQLHALRPSSPTGTAWGYTEAPRTKLTPAEVQSFLTFFNSLPKKDETQTSPTTTTPGANTPAPATTSQSGSFPSSGQSIYPNIKEANDIIGQLNQVLVVLGPQGYNVLPLDVFTNQQNITSEEMRTQITTAIDGRISDYKGLIADIGDDEIKFYELSPVMNDLMAAITNEETKEEINDYVSDEQTEEQIENVGTVVISIAALCVGVPPLIVTAGWVIAGIDMIQHGTSLTQGEGATDVMDPSTVQAGRDMVAGGVFIIMTSIFDAVVQVANQPVKNTSTLPAIINRTEGGINYVLVRNGPSSFIVRQPGVSNQFIRVTRNFVNQTDVVETWVFNPSSGLWEFKSAESRLWLTAPQNITPVVSNPNALTAPVTANQTPVLTETIIPQGIINPTRADLTVEEITFIDNYIQFKPPLFGANYSESALSTNALRILSQELGGVEVAQVFIKQGNGGYYQIYYGTSGNIVFEEFEGGTPYLINHVHGTSNPMPSGSDIDLLKTFQDIQRAVNMPVQTSSQIVPFALPNAKFNVNSPTKGN